ncbi:putative Agenet-like domain-containing protein [Helianthus annuus]|uniref:Agenet-like domain-containing protein n=1 Tax=Helianthus annuus TaxID=4232 RepID=A0A251V6K1_HELAN|nr:putative Agenet-like domain-containing protein [Helianthus annuus]KAJ0495876.1 putative Agenet-like domain-containing protein [Helianthus annuus]KAJ0591623.1 putative Agenet-like domain-containing protein [Helianthus annuus]KAJ0606517.1 putative Agenet-like domain-containing protein [Helianthus annuus]KAJ0772509.1 putative Agenet-like domain-containing protein [Helianthus annuus]
MNGFRDLNSGKKTKNQIMKYKRGSTVEVFCNQSWRCARIVSSKGHNYTVSYDVYPGFTSKDDVEHISVKSVRRCPPLFESSECWVPGDVAEVFHNLSWKMAIVLKDIGLDQFIVRLVGSSQEFEVTKSELRVRRSYQNGQWIVTGKVPSDHKEANSPKLFDAGPSVEERAILYLEAQDRVTKGASLKWL